MAPAMDEGLAHLIITHRKVAALGASQFPLEFHMSNIIRLSEARVGHRGVIASVGAHCHHQPEDVELERRLLELGLVEGARVELLHEGLFGRDPIAMKVDDMRVALRRREAASLTLELDPGSPSKEVAQ